MTTLKVRDGDGASIHLLGTGDGTSGDPFIPKQKVTKDGTQNAVFYKSLLKDGAVTVANRNMNVNGSVTPVRFNLNVPAGQIWNMTRLIFLIRDGGSFDSGGWGNNGGVPLANGMTVGLTIDGKEIDMTPIPWTSHADLAGVAYDITHHGWGTGDEFIVMRLTVTKAGSALRLNGDNGDTFWMQVNDDLTGLTEQRCMCQGWIEGVSFNDIAALLP